MNSATAKSGKKQVSAVKVTWSKAKYATGYKVYRSISGGKYTLAGSTSRLTFTDTKATTNKFVTYRIVATDGTSADASVASATSKRGIRLTASKPSAKKSGSAVLVRWKKRVNASGYRVYRAKGNGKYKLVKKVRSKSQTSWKDTTAKAGKTYYYKIKAYSTVDGKTYTSTYSDATKIKLKKKSSKLSSASIR